MKPPLDTTLGSTLPDPRGEDAGDPPALATFEHPDDRFELGAELGRGGMGRVLAATDVSLARPVAIKQILSTHPDDLIRFEREVRITAQLEHPSIVPIHEAARDAEGRPYYVMRRIEGDPLATRLDGADLRSRLALLPNLLAVADAAAFAHARNIIHRDIKPSNILLGAYGETHLIDWGLARRLDDVDIRTPDAVRSDELTQAGQVYGTVGYMAPEQARGEPVDKRADVYALGATLFHVIAGQAPFAHLSAAERLSAAVTGDDQPPLDRLGPDIPPELVAIVDKAMARDADRRYPHAGELAADLRAFLAGQLVGAHRYTTGERVRRFVRKHRFAVALSVVSLVVVIAITITAFTRVMEDKAKAEDALRTAEQERAEREAREDLLRIERASALAPADPERAAQLLLEVRADTPHRARARDTIAKIAAAGLGRSVHQHDKQVNSVAFSADGRWLASVGEDGKVALLDVETGASGPAIELHTPIYSVGWLDARTLLITGQDLVGGRLIDLESRAVRPFAQASSPDVWWLAGTEVRYLDQIQHAVFEIARTGGRERVVARDIAMVEGRDRRAVLAGGRGVWLLDGTTLRAVVEADRDIVAVALSTDGERFAYATPDEVIEREIATGRESGRWAVRTFIKLAYDGRNILVVGYPNLITALVPGGRIGNIFSLRTMPAWHARIASGLVFGFASGDLLTYDHAGFHLIANTRPGSRALGALPNKMRVAFGSTSGGVRLLDLDRVTPHPIDMPRHTTFCDASDRKMWFYGADGFRELDLETRTEQFVASPMGSIQPACSRRFGSRIVAHTPVRVTMVDVETRQVAELGSMSMVVFDGDRAIYADRDKVFELLPNRPPTPIYEAGTTVEALAALDRWLVVETDGKFRRIDRATPHAPVAETATATYTSMFGLYPDGRVWFADGRRLVIWDGKTVLEVASFDQRIRDALQFENSYFVALTDGSLWAAHPGQQPELRLPPGDRKLVFGLNGVAVAIDTVITTHFLRTRETIVRDIIQKQDISTFDQGRSLIFRHGDAFLAFRDPVPQDYEGARAWLQHMLAPLPLR